MRWGRRSSSRRREPSSRRRNFRAGGPHGLGAGEWTDDTSMALALADSIAEPGWDLNDQAARYVARRRPCLLRVNGRAFGIGVTTERTHYAAFWRSGDARTSGHTAARASGNFSITRQAGCAHCRCPVAVRRAGHTGRHGCGNRVDLRMCAGARSGFGEAYFGESSRGAVGKGTPLGGAGSALADIAQIACLRFWASSRRFHESPRAALGRRTPPGIWRFRGPSRGRPRWCCGPSPCGGIRRWPAPRAVNLGEGRLTPPGAVCGQLAGAHWAEPSIPTPWRNPWLGVT